MSRDATVAGILGVALGASIALNIAFAIRPGGEREAGRGDEPRASEVAVAAAPRTEARDDATGGADADGALIVIVDELRAMNARLELLEARLAEAAKAAKASPPSAAAPSAEDAAPVEDADGDEAEPGTIGDIYRGAQKRHERWEEDLGVAFRLRAQLSEDDFDALLLGGAADHLGFQGAERDAFIGELRAVRAELERAREDYVEAAKVAWREADGHWQKVEIGAPSQRLSEASDAAARRIQALLDPDRVPQHRVFVAEYGPMGLCNALAPSGLGWHELAEATGIPQKD